jgi:hypothetical protein
MRSPSLHAKNSDMASFRPETLTKIWDSGAKFAPCRTRETLGRAAKPRKCRRFPTNAETYAREPPNGGIKICPTTLIERGFSPDRGEKRSCWINTLPAISRLWTARAAPPSAPPTPITNPENRKPRARSAGPPLHRLERVPHQLTKDGLSGALTQSAPCRGTSCNVSKDVADYVIRRINDSSAFAFFSLRKKRFIRLNSVFTGWVV